MMSTRLIATAVVVAAMAVGSSSAAFAKAHDQGKADGKLCPICTGLEQNAREQIELLQAAGALDNRGVSKIQRDGARGALESTCKGGTDPDLCKGGAGRVVPVVNGK